MNRQLYQGKRIVLVMDVQGRDVVLRGTTSIRRDARQGYMLQIVVDDDDEANIGSPIFLISEDHWRHQICSGMAYDCEYLLDLSHRAVTADY